MVLLNRITTRGGDTGETSLGDGRRVPKTDLRIVACGSVDELNSQIGVVLATTGIPDPQRDLLKQIQNDLFDVGADLCMPASSETASSTALRVKSACVERLEGWTAECTAQLPAATSFILPGGTPGAAQMHVARAVCRRTEIDVLRLHAVEPVTDALRVYLNRLSDLLFVLARICNNTGRDDVLWIPGGAPSGA